MSYIPGRRFPRGGGGNENEQPWSVVKEDALCMDQTEMTNEQYEKTMKPLDGQTVTHRSQKIKIDATPSREGFDGPNQPVVDVSWYHADLACQQQGKRLPTESEWENAAKGPDGTSEYPTADGNQPTESNNNANFHRDTKDTEGTSDVGIYPEGPFGLEDMAGDVWEWTSDWYASSYDASSLQNPTGPASGQDRVARGGSWDDVAQYLRSAGRDYDYPGFSNDDLGFRCVQSPAQDSK
jgi:formylglycine-generating enzyme required for sulfatase activity